MHSENKEPLTDEQQKMMDLIHLCKKVQVFEFEGVMFMGELVHAVKEYMHQNPSVGFYIWLSDNYTILSKPNE